MSTTPPTTAVRSPTRNAAARSLPVASSPEHLIEIRDLHTHFFTDEGIVRAVDGVDLDVRRGKTLCIVGESGSGKSITARSILQIVDEPGRIVAGSIAYFPEGRASVEITHLHPRGKEIRGIRGREISMIFQEPMTSLSPVHTIGNQIVEAITLHERMPRAQARARAAHLLGRVGIPQPDQRLDSYPFQLSGGMRQRAMIAMALSCNPSLLIADEPTTALDVTTQANILDLVQDLQAEFGMSIIFITHAIGVVAEIADDVAVMYLGNVVERGSVDQIFHDPQHPYTRALLRSVPKMGRRKQGRQRLESIRGMVPHPFGRPNGCPYHTRCDDVIASVCDRITPRRIELAPGRDVRCLLHGGTDGSPEAQKATPT
jgi:oligopeptide/dipeptide ABC transporter ATP-binding protein